MKIKNKLKISLSYFFILIFSGLNLFFYPLAFAQENEMFDEMDDKSRFVLTEQIVNGSTKYINKKGEEVKSNPIYKLSLEERVKRGITSVVKNNSKLKNESTVTLTVTFLDVVNSTGYGFDDATSGATRRATVEQAVAYYANIITNTGSAHI